MQFSYQSWHSVSTIYIFFSEKKKSTAEETDQEFIEKRWQHERIMKDKDCNVEEQKIALQRAKLEQKEKKWARRFEFEEKRMKAEFELRTRESEARNEEREQRAEQACLQVATQQALLGVIQALAEKINN